MSVALGTGSFIQLTKETTYGTAITVTGTRSEIISADIAPIFNTIPDPSLNAASASPRAVFQAGFLYRGRIVVRLAYEGAHLKMFQGVLGSSTDGTLDAVSGGYDHTYKELIALPSYTIELMPGNPLGVAGFTAPSGGTSTGYTNAAVRYAGAKFTSCTVRSTAGTGADAMLQAEFEVLAKSCTVGVTPAALTQNAYNFPILFTHSDPNAAGVYTGVVNDGQGGAVTKRMRSFEVTINNTLDDSRWYLGSSNIDEPIRNASLNVRWRFTEEFQDYAVFSAAIAGSNATPRLEFREPTTLFGTGTTPTSRQFEMKSGTSIWSEYSNPVTGPGIVTANHTMQAAYNSSDLSALVVRFRNLDTTTALA
jgi:hypothetical protein